MSRAGDLKERITLQQRAVDDNGDRTGPWGDVFTCAAQIVPLKGTEPVMASRLQGDQPFNITVRACSKTWPIDNSFQAVNARLCSQVFDIRAASLRPTRDFVDLLVIWKVGQPNG